jgi:hypothetical protein
MGETEEQPNVFRYGEAVSKTIPKEKSGVIHHIIGRNLF